MYCCCKHCCWTNWCCGAAWITCSVCGSAIAGAWKLWPVWIVAEPRYCCWQAIATSICNHHHNDVFCQYSLLLRKTVKNLQIKASTYPQLLLLILLWWNSKHYVLKHRQLTRHYPALLSEHLKFLPCQLYLWGFTTMAVNLQHQMPMTNWIWPAFHNKRNRQPIAFGLSIALHCSTSRTEAAMAFINTGDNNRVDLCTLFPSRILGTLTKSVQHLFHWDQSHMNLRMYMSDVGESALRK